MSVVHTVLRSYKDQSPNTIQLSEVITGKKEDNYDGTVAIAANVNVKMAFTRADLLSLCLSSDQPVTIYTNDLSGGSPQDTIPLAAGQALVWSLATDLIGKCPFAGNVTTLYVTNASAAVANLKIRACLSA